ncbi:MAG: bacteriohemerythrin [Candidatus Zixiibacteriota bacterium]
MSLVTWQNSLSVGVPEMDLQHQKLIKLLNDFHQAMNDKHAKEKIQQTLDALAAYTVSHFRNEEEFMRRANFPRLAEHQKIHAKLVSEVQALQAKCRAGEVLVPASVMKFMWDWLQNHIMKEDQQYSPANKPTTAAAK